MSAPDDQRPPPALPLAPAEASDLDGLIGGAPIAGPQQDAYATLPTRTVEASSPGWPIAFGMLLGGVVVGAGLAVLLLPSGSPEAPITSAPSATAAPEPAPSASAAPAALTPIELAAKGDGTELEKLEAAPLGDRAASDNLALARGKRAQKIAEAVKLADTLGKSPDLAKDARMLSRLRKDAKDPDIGFEVLDILAAIPGPEGADVVYDIWVGTRGKDGMTAVAEGLVFSKDLRPRASEALSVALDLRTTTDCEEMKKVLGRAREHGDVRSIVPVSRVMRDSGCGEKERDDCFPCVRDAAGKKLLKEAMSESRKRLAPRF